MTTETTDCKCAKCGASATMLAPEDLCDECWARWWVDGILEGDTVTPEFRESLFRETLENLRSQR